MPDYSKGKIYSIRSYNNDQIYIGSTIQPLSVRMGGHLRDYKKYKNGKYNYVSSFNILEAGNYYIELIENFECKSKDELHRREGQVIRAATNCVNRCIAGRTYKEWREDNRGKIKEYYGQYKILNKNRIKQQQKEWREQNKEKLKQYKKEYNNQNREKKQEYNKQYNKQNKYKIQQHVSEKITCECGAEVRQGNLSRHCKTDKHKNNLIYNFLTELN